MSSKSPIIIIGLIAVFVFVGFNIATAPVGEEPYSYELNGKYEIHGTFILYGFDLHEREHKVYASNRYEGYIDIINNRYFNEQIESIANGIKALNLTPQEQLENVICDIQNQNYVLGGEGIKMPYTIIHTRESDCDERVLLAGGILNKLGFDTCMLLYSNLTSENSGESIGHARLGIINEDGIAQIELTEPAFKTYMYDSDFWKTDEVYDSMIIKYWTKPDNPINVIPKDVTGKEFFTIDGIDYPIKLYKLTVE